MNDEIIYYNENVYKLICPWGINLLYIEYGNNHFTEKWWSNIFNNDILPLPKFPNDIGQYKLTSFINSERKRSELINECKVFYGFYKHSIKYNVPSHIVSIADVVLKYDGKHLYNVKHRYMRNRQKIVLKNSIEYAWNNFKFDK